MEYVQCLGLFISTFVLIKGPVYIYICLWFTAIGIYICTRASLSVQKKVPRYRYKNKKSTDNETQGMYR